MTNLITLVIADDHPLFRTGLRDVILSDPELRVLAEASDGASALRLVRQHDPDMVILDIDMPGMGGLTVLRELSGTITDVNVIFLTMYREADIFNEAMDIGARGYVLKDSAVNDILSAIHTVADGRYYISPTLSNHLIQRSTRAENLLRHTPSLNDLTPAEVRILRLISDGKTSKEIADMFSISYKTVENHRTNITAKLHLRGSHSLLKFALENKHALGLR
jgi:DNA-binding NarL/FixJ family response regulator